MQRLAWYQGKQATEHDLFGREDQFTYNCMLAAVLARPYDCTLHHRHTAQTTLALAFVLKITGSPAVAQLFSEPSVCGRLCMSKLGDRPGS